MMNDACVQSYTYVRVSDSGDADEGEENVFEMLLRLPDDRDGEC